MIILSRSVKDKFNNITWSQQVAHSIAEKYAWIHIYM